MTSKGRGARLGILRPGFAAFDAAIAEGLAADAAWRIRHGLPPRSLPDGDPPGPHRTLQPGSGCSLRPGDSRLWGVSLCGPMVIVDEATGTRATSQQEPEGQPPAFRVSWT